MKDLVGTEEPFGALKKHFGEEKFLGILVLSFIDSFLSAANTKILPMPLFCFFPEEGGQFQFHVYNCEGKGMMVKKEVFCVGITDLLLGAAVSGIPVLLKSTSGMDHWDLAEDFLKILCGVTPALYFPELENGTLPPLIMNIENLGETEIRALKKIEKGETPGGEKFPAIVIVDPGQKETKSPCNLSGIRETFFSLSIPSPPISDSLAFQSSKSGKNGFDDFFEGFLEHASRYLETDTNALWELKEKWPALYSELTNYIQNHPLLLDSAKEWFHIAATVFATDNKKAFHHEIRTLIQWAEKFEMADLLSYPELEKNIHINQIEELFQNFESAIPAEDIYRIYKLAPFFSLINRVKQALLSPNPVESYFETPGNVTVRDIFIPFFIFLDERTKAANIDSPAILNMLVENYRDILHSLAVPLGLKGAINLEDPETSIRPRAFKSAIAESMEKAGGIDLMVTLLLKMGREIINHLRQEPCLLNLQIIFIANDIFTLTGFLSYYKKELSLIINCFGKESPVDDIIAAIKRFYNEKRRQEGILMPSIFMQSIFRILG
jgi:hypothetical protein